MRRDPQLLQHISSLAPAFSVLLPEAIRCSSASLLFAVLSEPLLSWALANLHRLSLNIY